MKTPSGLLQGATRRATASAWSLHPCLPLGSSQHLGSESKWAGLSQSCLGHREEGKIFSPDQLETTKEGEGHPETPSQGHRPPWQVHGQQSAAVASRLQERKGGFLCCQLLSPGALLLASRLFPRSFSTFMVLNLPFFLLSDSTSLWKSAAENKDAQPGREGGDHLDRMGQWPVSLSRYATIHAPSQANIPSLPFLPEIHICENNVEPLRGSPLFM